MQELWYINNNTNFPMADTSNINARLKEGWQVKMMVPENVSDSVSYSQGGVYIVLEKDD